MSDKCGNCTGKREERKELMEKGRQRQGEENVRAMDVVLGCHLHTVGEKKHILSNIY